MVIRNGTVVAALALSLMGGQVMAQETPAAKPAAAPAMGAPSSAGRELTMSKCFQCHTEAMWRDQRQGEVAWQATLYRMKARGAVWTDDDIKTMAAFLATDFGPSSPRAKPVAR